MIYVFRFVQKTLSEINYNLHAISLTFVQTKTWTLDKARDAIRQIDRTKDLIFFFGTTSTTIS